jgi:hypothetical protein
MAEPVSLDAARSRRTMQRVKLVKAPEPSVYRDDAALLQSPWRVRVEDAVFEIDAILGGLDVHERIAVTNALERLADDIDCMRSPHPWGDA